MTPAEQCDKLQRENGYWEVETSWETRLGPVTGIMRHIDYDKLRSDIDDLRTKCGSSFTVTDPIFWPPEDEFWASEHHLSQLLDNEEFLTSGRFKSPALW